jgi:hypothetical protein
LCVGYGISPSGSFDEDVLLRVRGVCACGRKLSRDDTLYEPAGTISLTRLLELSVLAADLARCLCGAWEGRSGHSYACYRLPGAGPYVVASSAIEARPRLASLTVRDQLPDAEQQGLIIPLMSDAELDAAERLGQPASVRAAWLEAVFDLSLGATSREFPCGAGLRCVATTNNNESGQLDLSVLRLPEGGPSEWLPAEFVEALERGDIMCLIRIDTDVVQIEVEAEARRLQLQAVFAGRRQLRLQRQGGVFALLLDTENLLASAVGSGRLLRLQAGHALTCAQQRLHVLDNAGSEIIARLQPLSSRAQEPGAHMRLQMREREVDVDVALYADAPVFEREHMLKEWEAA